jgi:hypothetical protein
MNYTFSALLFVLTGTLATRSFTDSGGKTIEAEFVSLADGTVTISKNGQGMPLRIRLYSGPRNEAPSLVDEEREHEPGGDESG